MPPFTRSVTAAAAAAGSKRSRAVTAEAIAPTKTSRNSKSSKKTTTSKTTKANKKQQQKPAMSAKPPNDATTALNLPWYQVFTKGDGEYNHYMATEWSFETRGDNALFERLTLEGAQSGLSWLTILRKRDAYRRSFHNFEVARCAELTLDDIQQMLDTTSDDARSLIVRHRGKIEATVNNAKCILKLQQQEADNSNALDTFLWSFVQNKPILNGNGNSLGEFPTQTPESQAMSKALKQKGFKFVGPTTCYALMQAVGMVIDHPMETPEWQAAKERLEQRPGGYQDRSIES